MVGRGGVRAALRGRGRGRAPSQGCCCESCAVRFRGGSPLSRARRYVADEFGGRAQRVCVVCLLCCCCSNCLCLCVCVCGWVVVEVGGGRATAATAAIVAMAMVPLQSVGADGRRIVIYRSSSGNVFEEVKQILVCQFGAVGAALGI